jgi:hypothetical protein
MLPEAGSKPMTATGPAEGTAEGAAALPPG